MNEHTQRFSGRAQNYHRYRQRYPADGILSMLRESCGLTEKWVVADIGAGTGMLAEVFLHNGNPVIAIEPNAEMRAQCEQLRATWPDVRILDATAEHTALPDHSVDLVSAGRAFHWFDRDRALDEFRRILRPGGWIVLVSLGRAHQDTAPAHREQIAAFERLLLQHGSDYNYVREGYRIHENLRALFPPPTPFYQQQLPGIQQLDWNAFQGQTMSLSVSPQQGHPNYSTFQQELRHLFDAHQTDGIITVPTTCWFTAAQID